MADINFYHLQAKTLEDVLPVLLEKALAADLRAVVRFTDAEAVTQMDKHLWTYDAASFLPHGTKKTGFEDQQPIYLDTGHAVPNNAKALFVINEASFEGVGEFERCFYLFDGRSDHQTAHARTQWKALKEDGHKLIYWQQDEAGRWKDMSRSDS